MSSVFVVVVDVVRVKFMTWSGVVWDLVVVRLVRLLWLLTLVRLVKLLKFLGVVFCPFFV